MSWMLLTAGLFLLTPEQVAGTAPMLVNVRDCKQDYALVERSLEIAARATEPSDPKFDAMVAADAQFELWDGDFVWEPRDEQGTAAARSFFKQVGSTDYVAHKGIGPICVVGGNRAVIEFISPDGKRSTFVTFDFDGSRLIRANGWTDIRDEGKLNVEALRG